MRSQRDELVTVVVPAYNAEHTIHATLCSVRNQTHDNLDIIVVDDGSADRTRAVAERHARADSRIRVVAQDNAGVAAARNHGIALAAADYLAPIDADDLWRPDKIERQLRALRAAGEEAGLAYSWSSIIDARSRVVASGDTPHHAGDVLLSLAFGNFVGNGSTALMRKAVVVDAGGYDASLRARQAQGCEDWKLFLAIAERSHFTVIHDHLTGYRQSREAMSGDVLQMLRSDALVRHDYLERHREHREQVEHGRREYILWMLRRELESGHWAILQKLMPLMQEASPTRSGYLKDVARIVARYGKRRLKPRRVSVEHRLPYLRDPPTPAVRKIGAAA